MKCEVCGAKVEKGWEFCVRCGTRIRKSMWPSIFGGGVESIFKHFSKEMERIEKEMSNMEREFGVIDLRSLPLREIKPGARGFSIRISSKTGEKPKIDVRTWGDVERKEIKQQVAKQLGVSPEEVRTVEEKSTTTEAMPKIAKRLRERIPRVVPAVTEEPKTNVVQLPGKVVVELELPGVESDKDVDVTEMEESTEVKAYAKDKVYFKIITLPPELSLTGQDFKQGKLRLEFGY